MEKLKKKFIISSLYILIFIFILAYIAPMVSEVKIQEILFGISIIVTLLGYFILTFQCARQAKVLQSDSCNKKNCLCIRFVFYGLLTSLLLNLPLIGFSLLYLLAPRMLTAIIGTIDGLNSLVRFFVIPWGLFLIVIMMHLIVSCIFAGQMLWNNFQNKSV